MRASQTRRMRKSSTEYIKEIYEIEMLGYSNKYEISYLNKSSF